MPRELTDQLLANADFGEHVFLDDSGADSSTSADIIEISKPLFFADSSNADGDSVCESMDIKVNLKEKSVVVEHQYALNIEELERIVWDYHFKN